MGLGIIAEGVNRRPAYRRARDEVRLPNGEVAEPEKSYCPRRLTDATELGIVYQIWKSLFPANQISSR